MELFNTATKHYDWARNLRRYFHQYPEISGQESCTQKKIISVLSAMGITCRPAASTGVIAEIKGQFPGKTIALRADMDALPIQDECDDLSLRSKNDGACHACAHDAHMAILLGTICTINDLKSRLHGTFRFVFQPSEEEFPSGALKIIADGGLQNVDAIIGTHVWQPLPLGTVGISYSNLMAAPDKFTITIRGKGGHGSMPHQTIDPTLVGAQIILALHTVVSRNIDPLDLAVLSVGSLHTGIAFNIIPDTAVIEGTVRTFKQTVREQIFRRIEDIANGIASAHHATCSVNAVYGHPAVVNNESCAKAVELAAAACHSGIHAEIIPPVMCAEDFAHYLERIPGAFFFVGTGSSVATYPHHHPKFSIEEESILHGIEIMTRTAISMATDQ